MPPSWPTALVTCTLLYMPPSWPTALVTCTLLYMPPSWPTALVTCTSRLDGTAVARWAKAPLSSRLSSLCFTPLRPKFNPRTGQRPYVWKFHQLLAVGRWFPPGTPVSSTSKLISSSFHRLDMTLAVAEYMYHVPLHGPLSQFHVTCYMFPVRQSHRPSILDI